MADDREQIAVEIVARALIDHVTEDEALLRQHFACFNPRVLPRFQDAVLAEVHRQVELAEIVPTDVETDAALRFLDARADAE